MSILLTATSQSPVVVRDRHLSLDTADLILKSYEKSRLHSRYPPSRCITLWTTCDLSHNGSPKSEPYLELKIL